MWRSAPRCQALFAAAYNKQLKIQRVVFYTPQPVVSYIARSVHELLQTEFGLADSLASTGTWGEMIARNSHPQISQISADGKAEGSGNLRPSAKSADNPLRLPPLTDEPGETRTISPDEPFVQILDPTTGTATFLVEVIDVIHRHLEVRWKKSGLAAMLVLPKAEPRPESASPPEKRRRTAELQKLASVRGVPELRDSVLDCGSPLPLSHGREQGAPATFADYWNQYVPRALLRRLHAFELMMAPYAIAHYQKIVVALTETIQLMAEIDAVIEQHGGWPGAFAANASTAAREGAQEAVSDAQIAVIGFSSVRLVFKTAKLKSSSRSCEETPYETE